MYLLSVSFVKFSWYFAFSLVLRNFSDILSIRPLYYKQLLVYGFPVHILSNLSVVRQVIFN